MLFKMILFHMVFIFSFGYTCLYRIFWSPLSFDPVGYIVPYAQLRNSIVQSIICVMLFSCYRLDHILLETTGLANPAPLASVLWLDDQLESAVRLDSIITVSCCKLF